MPWKFISLLACLALPVMADVSPFERESVDKLTVTSDDGTAKLTVSLERIDREKIRHVYKGKDQAPEAWIGKRRLPSEILWHRASLISGFELQIDGKNIPVPAQFWNDLAGLKLEKIIINKKPTNDNECWLLDEFTLRSERPQLSRSAHGGTVLITWIRPEE